MKKSVWVVPVLCATALWLVVASWIYCWRTGQLQAFAWPYMQWCDMLPYALTSRRMALYMAESGGVPLLAMLAIGRLTWLRGSSSRKLSRTAAGEVRAVEAGVTDNHGHASWMSMRDAQRAFPGPANYGGVVVGEAYRVDEDKVAQTPFDPISMITWGRGGSAELLIDPCNDGPTHSLIFAGSGGFKSVSAVTTILTWNGSSVVLDPSCELGPMVSDALRIHHRKAVHFLDPERPEDAKTWGFNVLDWINTEDPLAEMHVHTVVSWIYGDTTGRETEEELFFRKWGKDLVVCLLADLLWDDKAIAPKTLATLVVGIGTPQANMRRLLHSINKTSKSLMARHIAGTLMEIVDETFSGIYANATGGTSWLSQKAFCDLVSGDAFGTRDIIAGTTTVFVQIPLPALMATPGIGRVIVGSLLNAVYEAKGKTKGRILFLLDEVARLGRMKVIETARDVGRKYGITLQLLYQSVGQLEQQWGRDGKRSWYDGVSWRGYAAVRDRDTAKEVSDLCGNYGVLAYSEGENSGKQNKAMGGSGSRSKGRNTNVHEISRPLIRPEEVIQDMRSDEMIVISGGRKPLRCGRAIYFRRQEMVSQIKTSKFIQDGTAA